MVAMDDVVDNWGDTYFRDVWDRTDREQRVCLIALKKLKRGTVQKLMLQGKMSERVTKEALHTLPRGENSSEKSLHLVRK
jgi:hypothetical protein